MAMCFMKTPYCIMSEETNEVTKSKEKGGGIQMKRRKRLIIVLSNFIAKCLLFRHPFFTFTTQLYPPR